MLVKATFTLLAATLAIAAPSKRQSEPNLRILLTNTELAITDEYEASTDGPPVAVNTTFTVDEANVACLDICVPEFHCELYDKNLAPIINLPPGTSHIDPASLVGQIICGSGLPDKKREVQESAPAARQTVPYAGAAVFTQNTTGWETGFAFYLGQTVSLAERTLYYSSATVYDVNAPSLPVWSCHAFGVDGEDMGVFWASEKFLYTFVPGVVASFLCE